MALDRRGISINIRELQKILNRCAIRVGAYATQGEYDDQSMLNILFIEALVRWEERGIE